MKVRVYGEEAKELAKKIGLAADEDQSPVHVLAVLRLVEGRAVVELEV
jgi:hypothetical protein